MARKKSRRRRKSRRKRRRSRRMRAGAPHKIYGDEPDAVPARLRGTRISPALYGAAGDQGLYRNPAGRGPLAMKTWCAAHVILQSKIY